MHFFTQHILPRLQVMLLFTLRAAAKPQIRLSIVFLSQYEHEVYNYSNLILRYNLLYIYYMKIYDCNYCDFTNCNGGHIEGVCGPGSGVGGVGSEGDIVRRPRLQSCQSEETHIIHAG